MRKYIIRFYARHDADLIYASFNKCISFTNFTREAIRSFVNNKPLDTSIWASPYEIGTIRSKQLMIYLDEEKDAKAIETLDACPCINTFVKMILRYYLVPGALGPAISKLCLSGTDYIDDSKQKPKQNKVAVKQETVEKPVLKKTARGEEKHENTNAPTQKGKREPDNLADDDTALVKDVSFSQSGDTEEISDEMLNLLSSI